MSQDTINHQVLTKHVFANNICVKLTLVYGDIDALADLWGSAPPPTFGLKFSRFHAVFRKILQFRMLAPAPHGWRPFVWGILDPPLIYLRAFSH